MSKGLIPSAIEILQNAEKINPNLNINQLHSKTFELMKLYRTNYYESRVNELLSSKNLISISNEMKLSIKKELLNPIIANETEYSNFMEEVSRRVSQTFQVISGNLAELCVERELNKIGLKTNIDYVRKKERTDFIIYYRVNGKQTKKHRIEVKNVKLRERGARGLAFDGDSMVGFFDQPSEFTESNIEIIDEHCKKTGGYCYIPLGTLELIKNKTKRFKANTELALDMKKFVNVGFI
ncbi:hypothetical protein J4214_05250 [Candidatus Woesearchaeota archaeon]|nr:hypothetical protein [Candidatus Woesearchaeota archaeon]